LDGQFDLEVAADEELERACDLSWRELRRIIPWGDTYSGFTQDGRGAEFERNYIWAGDEGGDILCEVAVFREAASYDRAARRNRLIRKG
jgi:hypothetical protein